MPTSASSKASTSPSTASPRACATAARRNPRSAAAAHLARAHRVAARLALAEELFVAHDALARMARAAMPHIGVVVGNADEGAAEAHEPGAALARVTHGRPPLPRPRAR